MSFDKIKKKTSLQQISKYIVVYFALLVGLDVDLLQAAV